MNKKNDYLIKRRQPVWKCVSGILKLFVKKPKIVSLSGELPQRAIYLANHSTMFGPLGYSMYLPTDLTQWGAWPMLGNFKSRYRYLKDVYFIQKRHKSKFAATILAFIDAIFSPGFYRGMRIIPSYDDSRMLTTLHLSDYVLENDFSVLICPEDSSNGYHETLTGFYAGFVELAKYYKLKHGDDLPIYPVYYHRKKRVIVIGEPSKLTDYTDKGMDRNQIARAFCDQVNNLFVEHIKDKEPKKT